MKKMLLAAVALVSLSTAAFSQGRMNVDPQGLLKKIERSDADIQNPKKMENPSTWIARGKVFFDAENDVMKNILDGWNETLANTLLGVKPVSREVVTMGNSEFMKLTYPAFVAYTDPSGAFVSWEPTEFVYKGALDKSTEAYVKAAELDAAGKNADKISQGLQGNFNYVYKLGSLDFAVQRYRSAADNFAKAYGLTQLAAFGPFPQNTVASVAHDTGLAYFFAADYQKSLDFFTIAKNMGYERDGEIYYLMYHAYKGISSTDTEVLKKAKAIVEEGMAKYPENANLIETLTDAYIALGEDAREVLPIVQAAVDKDPTNPALWNGIGRLYERLGDLDDSIAAFEQVAKLMPDSFNPYYSIGLLYIEKGNQMLTAMSTKTYAGQAEFNAEQSKAFEVFAKSIAPLEKAHQLNPADFSTVELLKNVTFRLREQSGIMEKYEKYNELYKQMK